MDWFRFVQNKRGNTGSNELWLLTDFGDYLEGVTVETVAKELKALPPGSLTVFISSYGGDVFCARGVAALLKSYAHPTTAVVLSVAASAASFVALSCQRLIMDESAFLMVHNCHAPLSGDAAAHRKIADELDTINDSIAQTYFDRLRPDAGVTLDHIRRWMAEEHWFSAPEARSLGWCDEIASNHRVAARATIDSTRLRDYRNVPPQLLTPAPNQTDLFSRLRLVNLNLNRS